MTSRERQERPRIVLVNRTFVIGEDGKLLFLQRSDKNDYGAGLWEPPGGKLEEGEDVSHALEDEVLEETGLLVQPISRFADVESAIISEGKYRGMTYIALIGISKPVGGKFKLSDEHTAERWVTIDEAYDLPLKPEIRKALITL